MTKNQHTPGPIEEAAARIYYERGSLAISDVLTWKKFTAFFVFLSAIQAVAITMLIPLKSIEIVKISQDNLGKVKIVENQDSNQRYSADAEAQMFWVSQWTTDAFEINEATWRRNLTRAITRTSGAAKEQINEYLVRQENNPVIILEKDLSFVREVERISINTIQPNVILIRFKLISRMQNGVKMVKTYAMTVTLKNIQPKTREELIDNPAALSVQSFSISDESVK